MTGMSWRAQAIALYLCYFFLLQYCSYNGLLTGYVFYRSGLLNEESLLRIMPRINEVCKPDLMLPIGMLMVSEGGLGF